MSNIQLYRRGVDLGTHAAQGIPVNYAIVLPDLLKVPQYQRDDAFNVFVGGVCASYHAARHHVKGNPQNGIYASYAHEGFQYGKARAKGATTRGLPMVACLFSGLNDNERAQALSAFVCGAIDGFTTEHETCEQ